MGPVPRHRALPSTLSRYPSLAQRPSRAMRSHGHPAKRADTYIAHQAPCIIRASIMSRTQRFLTAIGVITAIELSLWIVARSGWLAWQEWHRTDGLHWLATLMLFGSLGTAIVVNWLLIIMVRS